MKIVFDVDGVLADFVLGFTELANQMYGTPIYSTTEQREWERFDELNPAQVDKVWQQINQSRDYWYGLQPLATRQELDRIGQLSICNDIYFVTSRHSYPTVRNQTRNWLHLYGVPDPTVILTNKKAEFSQIVKADFLLEDRPVNAIAAGRVTKAYLLDQPYNRWVNPPEAGVRRVETVTEFLDEILDEVS